MAAGAPDPDPEPEPEPPLPDALAPAGSTLYSISTVPAFSNTSVPLSGLPASGAACRSINITWYEPGLSVTVSPGLISSPACSGRMRITPSVTAISCTSKRPALTAEPPISRSAAAPVLVIVMKPPATLAAGGGMRSHASSILSSPIL